MVSGITTSLLFCLTMFGSAIAAPTLGERAESHKVEIINRCGAGRPVFLYAGNGERGPGVVDGPLMGGVAYLAGYKDCLSSGVNCGTVEFTLVNPAPGAEFPMQNAINYSLLDGIDVIQRTGLGNHKYKYPMNFEFTGGQCESRAPGQCLGQSAAKCPGAFLGDQTRGGKPVVCQGSNAGIRITFC